MTRRVQLREFSSERFLREIHHFLWIDPQRVGDSLDAGWSCREHALVLGLLVESFGHRTLLVHGEAFFARGASGKSASTSFSQKPHNWVLVQDVGAIDISIKPDFDNAGDRFRLPLNCIFANEWLPRGRGRVFFVDDAGVFARAAAELPQQRNHATAVYLTREIEHLHYGHITHSAGWAGSALTSLLDAQYGNPSDLYAALMLHLRAFVLGDAPGLSKLSFHASWAELARAREGAIERARSCVRSAPSDFRSAASVPCSA